MKFLDDNKNKEFLGTNEKNEKGQDLYEFLEDYDPNRYQNPSNTVDILVFTYVKDASDICLKKLLLIKRGNHPCIGMWATPGGFIEFKESIDAAAKRELEEETGIKDIEIKQLKSYGEYDRDPRTRIITTAYVALVEEGKITAKAGDDAKDAKWFDLEWEYEDIAKTDEIVKQLMKIRLKSDDLSVGATVEKKYKEHTLLKNVEYKLIESNKLAADHGAIIAEAIEYVKDKF